jgi:hypothetical protein
MMADTVLPTFSEDIPRLLTAISSPFAYPIFRASAKASLR